MSSAMGRRCGIQRKNANERHVPPHRSFMHLHLMVMSAVAGLGRWGIEQSQAASALRGGGVRSHVVRPERAEHLLPNRSAWNICVQCTAMAAQLNFDPERLTARPFDNSETDLAHRRVHSRAAGRPVQNRTWRLSIRVLGSAPPPVSTPVCQHFSQFPIHVAPVKDQVWPVAELLVTLVGSFS